MFLTNAHLSGSFEVGSDNIITCNSGINQQKLTELCKSAASNNFWISKQAINILKHGVDIEESIPYLELLRTNDWILLLSGLFSEKFVKENVEHVNENVWNSIKIKQS